MTDEQLEVAARKLCELRGWNPDGNTVTSVQAYGTWLNLAKREILNFYQAAQAIDHALGGEQFP